MDRNMDYSTSISARQPFPSQNGSYQSPQRKRHTVMSRKLASNHGPPTPSGSRNIRSVSAAIVPSRRRVIVPDPLSVRRVVKSYRKAAGPSQRREPDVFQRDTIRAPRMSAIQLAPSRNEETPPTPLIERRFLISRKCARKSKPTALTLDESSSDDSDSGSVSVISDDRAASPPNLDDDEIQITSTPNIPPPELAKVLQYLRPVSRLPFLRRNLRTGFYLACKRTGIKTDTLPESLAPEVDILFTIHTSDPDISHSTKMRGWHCPFCNQHNAFKTQQMLLIHLKWDHSEFEVECHQVFNFFDPPTDRLHWKLHLTLPRPDITPTSANIDDEHTSLSRPSGIGVADGRQQAEINLNLAVPTALVEDETMVEEPLASEPQDRHEITELPDNGVHPGPADEGTDNAEESFVGQSLVEKEPHIEDADMIAEVQAGVSSMRIRSPEDSSSFTAPHQYDFMRPAIRYPYLPFRSYDGGNDIYYSCRPRGPRIYDLLGALSMDKFGVLAWEVLDREEEIFEHNSYPDELKVMQALWARWIKLNRNVFNEDNVGGVKAFVDEYWRMVYYAAGYAAFRLWLLMMLTGGYISGIDVAGMLRFYREKVDAHVRDAERAEVDI
ncbi:hypothetical protein BDZ89DRAFT_1163360 [Hymenopellis radicata]|nr:hypothetical protein BDZ89DRAFT_1163360 [Hymenopellis radicata]